MEEDRRSFFQRSLAAGALTVGALAASTSEAQTPAQTPSKSLRKSSTGVFPEAFPQRLIMYVMLT